MRILGGTMLLGLLLAMVPSSGRTQCLGQSCPQGAVTNCWVPGPYPRYPGYGVSSSNYYTQALPPFLAGGPAYAYTYPYPWSALCAPPRNYIAPAYPAYYYYPHYGQSASYYSGPSSYQSTFATERTSSYPSPRPTTTAATTTTSNSPPPAPAKNTASRTPATLPESLPSKNDPAASSSGDTTRKPLWRRLFFLQ